MSRGAQNHLSRRVGIAGSSRGRMWKPLECLVNVKYPCRQTARLKIAKLRGAMNSFSILCRDLNFVYLLFFPGFCSDARLFEEVPSILCISFPCLVFHVGFVLSYISSGMFSETKKVRVTFQPVVVFVRYLILSSLTSVMLGFENLK